MNMAVDMTCGKLSKQLINIDLYTIPKMFTGLKADWLKRL